MYFKIESKCEQDRKQLSPMWVWPKWVFSSALVQSVSSQSVPVQKVSVQSVQAKVSQSKSESGPKWHTARCIVHLIYVQIRLARKEYDKKSQNNKGPTV